MGYVVVAKSQDRDKLLHFLDSGNLGSPDKRGELAERVESTLKLILNQ
jgi:hypothetical protein